MRQVRLPEGVGRLVLSRRGDAGIGAPYSPRRKRGDLTQCAVNGMVKRTTKAAERYRPHCLPHAHGAHAIDGGAMLAQVRATLGHDPLPQPVVTCLLGRTPRAACTLIQGSPSIRIRIGPMIGSEQSLGMHNEGSHRRPLR